VLAVAQFVATLSCTLFTGAAVYITLVEHPARMGCGTAIAMAVWAPSYRRATVVQVPLALMSFVAGVLSWWLGGGAMWLVGALVMVAVVPFTLIVIAPINHALLAPTRDPASAEARTLLERWGQLHAVRSALSLAASVVFVSLLLSA
jgi:uncharacterized membrane protein